MAETMSEETKQLVQSLLVGLDVETLRADALDLNVNVALRKRNVNEKNYLVTEIMKSIGQRAAEYASPMTALEKRIDAAVKARMGEDTDETYAAATAKRAREETCHRLKEETEALKVAEAEAKEVFQKRVFKDERNGHEFNLLRKASVDIFVALKVDLGMPVSIKSRLQGTLQALKLRMGTLATANEHGWNVALEFLNRKEKTGDFFDEFRADVSEAVKTVNASSSGKKKGMVGSVERRDSEFNGRCNNCSAFGHKAFDCPRRSSMPPPPSRPQRFHPEDRFHWRAPAPQSQMGRGGEARWG